MILPQLITVTILFLQGFLVQADATELDLEHDHGLSLDIDMEASSSERMLQSLCQVSTEIKCFLNDSTNRECSDMDIIPLDQCDDINVTFQFKFCNDMTDQSAVDLLDGQTYIKVLAIRNNNFNKANILGGTCRTIERSTSINTCGRVGFNVEMKLEGWIADFTDQPGFYCNSYSFLRVIIPRPTPIPSPVPSICDVSTEITCFLNDNTNRECSDMDIIPSDQCDDINVTFQFKFCNDMTDPSAVDLLDGQTYIKVLAIRNNNFNKANIPSGTCRTIERSTSINPCGRVGFNVEMKLEGWIADFTDQPGFYCNSYSFLRVIIPRPPSAAPTLTSIPSKKPSSLPSLRPSSTPLIPPRPTLRPSLTTTNKPSFIPTIIPSKEIPVPSSVPSIGLSITCLGKANGSGIFNIPCESLLPSQVTCQRDLFYRYTIVNHSAGPISVESLIVNDNGTPVNLINELIPMYVPVEETCEVDRLYTIDFCTLAGDVVTNSATVVATTASPSDILFTSSNTFEFTVPLHIFNIKVYSAICIIAETGTSCNDYILTCDVGKACNVQASFRFFLTNTGPDCTRVNTVSVKDSFSYTESLSVSDNNRFLCPNEEIILVSETRNIDFLVYAGTTVIFEFAINNGGTGCHPLAYYTFYHLSSPPVPSPLPGSDTCTSQPSSLTFTFHQIRHCQDSSNSQYQKNGKGSKKKRHRKLNKRQSSSITGEKCKKSNNRQLSKKAQSSGNGTFYCNDGPGNVGTSALIVVTSLSAQNKVYFEGQVFVGDEFEVTSQPSALAQELSVMIYQADRSQADGSHLAQSFRFDSSCSTPMSIGETFGYLKLVAFVN